MHQFQKNIKDIPPSTARIIQDYQTLYSTFQGLDQEELSQLYKTQAQTSTRLLELLDTLKDKEDTISKITRENSLLLNRIKVAECSVNDLKDNAREKEGVIQILQDELSAHQLELISKESKIQEYQIKVNSLTIENSELVEKLVQLKQEQANLVNESNESRWSFLKKTLVGQTSNESFKVNTRVPSCVVPSTISRKITSESDINCISLSKNGELVGAGSNDKNLILLNAKTGSKVGVLGGAMQGIMFTDFLDSELVLGASNDQSIKIWQVNNQRLKTSLTGHLGKVYSARFIQDNTVISGSHDRTIKIWDLTKGYCVKTIFSLSSCNDLTAANLDGSVIISGHLDSNIRFWDSRSGVQIREIIGTHAAQITGLSMFSDFTKVLTTSRDNTLKVIDIRTFSPVLTITNPNFKVGLNWSKSAVSPDGRFIASGGQDGSLFVWNSLTGELETTLKGHSSAICGTVWSPLGKGAVYTADKDKNVVFWS